MYNYKLLYENPYYKCWNMFTYKKSIKRKFRSYIDLTGILIGLKLRASQFEE